MLKEARCKRQILHNSIYIEYKLIYNDMKQVKDESLGADGSVLCFDCDGGFMSMFGCQNSRYNFNACHLFVQICSQ